VPKSIESQLSPDALRKAWREWCEQVTDEWIAPRAEPSPEHPSRKGFTREELIELAHIARLGDDGFRTEITPEGNPGPRMCALVKAMYREFGYTLGFMQHVRDCMADDEGFYVNKATGIRERSARGGKIVVDARFFRRLREHPFIAQWFTSWCKQKAIAPSNPALCAALESTGRYHVLQYAIKESTRKRK
jgi:hypothetical protein